MKPSAFSWGVVLLAGLLIPDVRCATRTQVPADTVRVAVFVGHGGDSGCIVDTLESLRLDTAMQVSRISSDHILNGALEKVDVLVIPGGSGSQQYADMGAMAAAAVKRFVTQEGGGIVGLCAGAYFLSSTPGYPCLGLCDYRAVDMEHDARGHGIVAFETNAAGNEVFPELKAFHPAYIHYYEGPLLVPLDPRNTHARVLATLITDVHLRNSAPAGITPGKPFLLNGRAGRGRYFLSVGHPENTPGMRWVLPRMVRWVAGLKTLPYSLLLVRPGIYRGTILFDKELRRREEQWFNNLVKGNKREKIEGIRELTRIRSFSVRSYLPGLLRDGDGGVRLAAAAALVDLERTEAIPDLSTVTRLEKDPRIRARLQSYLKTLKAMTAR